MNLALIICALVIIGAAIGFAFLRGLPKSRIRGIKHVLCFLLALLGTFLTKGSAKLAESASTAMESTLENASSSELVQTLLADGSIVGFVSALLAPLLFLLFFIALEIVLGIAYIILIACLSKNLKKSACEAKAKALRTILWALCSALLILVVIFAPLSAYSEYAVVASEAIPEDATYSATVDEVHAAATEVESSIMIKTHRTLFGWLDNALASFKVGEAKSNVKTELPAIAASVSDVQIILENGDFNNVENVAVIRRLADRMGGAPLLSSLLGTVIYEVSDQYITDPANASDPIPYTVMTILHKDANDSEKLRADFYTFAEVLDIYGKVEGALGTETLNKLLKIIKSNANMQPLLDEVDRMARELVEETVSFSKAEDGEYTETVVSTVEEFNDISKLPRSEQKAKVVEVMEDLLDDTNGLDATSRQINYFADVVVNELIPEQGGEITPASAEAFLVDYINEHWEELVEQGIIEIE